MYRKLLGVLAVTTIFIGLVIVLAAGTSFLTSEGKAAAEPAEVAKLPPVAIGAFQPSGTHLVPPRDDVILAELFEGGDLPLDATPEQIEAARREYLREFAKKSATWVSPEFQEWAMQREAELASPGVSAQQIQPVTATVFAMAIDFGATETFTLPVDVDGQCVTQTVTITGPLNGLMAQPPVSDNFSLWYSPSLTSDAKFYEKIIFGYEGAGRARYDMTDPDDGQPGINLAGYTVQDYYDHVAGDGNVYITGTVEGWVTVNHSEGYYGADNCATGSHGGGAGVPVAQLVVDAIDVFSATNPTYYTDTNPDAFWPQFDANGDGVLDTFWVIHAGAGQESGGGEQGDFAIWSHSSDLRFNAQWEDGYKVYEGDVMTTTDDIVVGPYTMQPENAETGVFAEEFGHNFFGFPDLYTTDASNSIGDWAIMSGGAWMGWLGGTAPASMPLWFKMIAAFDDGSGTPQPVNWHEPMFTRAYTDTTDTVDIGQLEKTPTGVNKGVRVNLPDIVETIANMTGSGTGAYSGTARDQVDIMLDRQVAIGASATGVLTMSAYWDIEEDWDYGYVMVNGTLLDDMDGVFRETNPNGNNLGSGLTGYGSGVLRFDLSAYAGETVTVTLRYRTDAAVTNPGWWVDNVSLDGTLIDDFETATAPGTFPGWTNSDPGWLVVPTTAVYESYYLVEWRSLTKYDQMIQKTAYIHNHIDPDIVSRIPYNMPAALLYYRNTKYGSTYAMHPNESDPPSYGSKYQLLIVDMNWEPTRIFSDTEYMGYWTGRVSSYDSGLTLQDTDPFTIPTYWGIDDLPSQFYPSKPAVTSFNDALGYYSGEYYGAPCPPGYVCWNERDGSAVIPARGLYSSRIVDFDGNPIYGFYGLQLPWLPSWWGSGKPGDDNVHYGVTIDLVSKAGDDAYNSTATLRFNSPAVVEVGATATPEIVVKAPQTYTVTYQAVVENTGPGMANGVYVTYTLDADLTAVSMMAEGTLKGTTLPPVGTIVFPTTSWWTDEMWADDIVTVTLVATGTANLPLADDTLQTMLDVYDGGALRGPWPLETDITAPSVSFVTPTDGQTINAVMTTTVPIQVATTDFDIPADGHWHLWMDGVDTGPVLTYTTSISMSLGTHVITAQLRLPDHTVLGPLDEATVTVEPLQIFLPIVFKNF